MAKTLHSLFDYLDNLQGQADLHELTARMAALDIRWQDVAEFIKFSDQHYARNLIRAGDWYYALALCWKNGQRSPIHDHHGSTCGVRVLRGIATETRFEFAPNGMVKAVCSNDYSLGSVCGSLDSDMHQISNLQAGNADLVTLHIYSPPLLHMGTYSMLDDTRGVEPLLLEFCDAAGI